MYKRVTGPYGHFPPKGKNLATLQLVVLWSAEFVVRDVAVLVAVLVLENVFHELILVGNFGTSSTFGHLLLQVIAQLKEYN